MQNGKEGAAMQALNHSIAVRWLNSNGVHQQTMLKLVREEIRYKNLTAEQKDKGATDSRHFISWGRADALTEVAQYMILDYLITHGFQATRIYAGIILGIAKELVFPQENK